MDISNKLKNAFAAFTGKTQPTKNSYDPNSFLKYGGKKTMGSTWSTPEISDQDFYTGYGFAVINKRANRAVTLGKNFLFTNASPAAIKAAQAKDQKIVHPYLDLIRSSDEFSERDFWYTISTYLDLEGIFYLMAVRTVTASGIVGNVTKFSLLNPYQVRAVVDNKGVLGGYVEQRNDAQRMIPKEMIIPIKLLNPFDQTQPYALADASRDSQFTLKQSNDYAREAINGNLNSPGIISTSIELPDDQFDNFVNRIKNHGRGEPLFGNGAGTVGWVDMQTDLDKAALADINAISRDSLLAVSGTSKTGMGVEDTGTGREVSRTQKDDFTENAVMPQVENIIDSLNLDYRKYYKSSWKTNGFTIYLDNPLETDRDAEQADVDIRTSQFTLLQDLIAAGYDRDKAADYAMGEIDLDDLGEPAEPEVEEPTEPEDESPMGDGADPNGGQDDQGESDNEDTAPAKKPAKKPAAKPVNPKNDYSEKHFDVYEGYPIPVLQYLGDNADQITAISEKASFIYSTVAQDMVRINRIDAVGNSIIAVVDENTYIKLGEFANNADRVAILTKLNKRYSNQPVAVKKKIELDHDCDVYEIIKNAAPFDKQSQIESNTSDLRSSAEAAEDGLYEWYVHAISDGSSTNLPSDKLQNFIDSLTLPFAVFFTVMFPIYAAHRVQQTAKEHNIPDATPIIAMTTEVKQRINDFAKAEATSHMNTIKTDLENALAIIKARTSDPSEIKAQLAEAFKAIQARRALTISNNAAARIFNISQFEADKQFLTRAGLIKQAYKVLFSLTGDPCAICASIIESSNAIPVPFEHNFVDLGETVEADGLKMTFNFENIDAGNVHPNCHCAYRLIIKNDVA